jgi:pullulanase/glycogen debranching enzyme
MKPDDKKTILSYGAFLQDKGINFKLFAPNALTVHLVIFDKPEAESGTEYAMMKFDAGDWSYKLKNAGIGTMYGYRLSGPLNDSNVIVADPYSKASITQNSWRHIAKSLVINDEFDWQGDTWLNIPKSDLIIYEAHVRDMTIHPSSNASALGSYKGFIEKGQKGGIEHLKSLGVNAVQFLPLWDYANVEIPYKKEAGGMLNDWNPYERNHWGYMPTFYMAPESYYASDGTNKPNEWNGKQGLAVTEMKEMVKALHHENISIILDVVVNHVSNYDWHPLKYIDKSIYFKLDDDGNYLSQCCGNILATDQKPVQNYIIESLKYWMTEYHIDGFRFDQAHLLSSETAQIIINELRSVNPNVIIYGEAWDNREKEFSHLDWGSFNAHFRDVLRGDLHRFDEKGFLFGEFRHNETIENVKSLINGTPDIYQNPEHSINFLEVHDDYCFNDYLRLSLGINRKDEIITNPMEHIRLNKRQLQMNKLGVFILMTSQGIPLIHQGQEWAHSQIIAESDALDLDIGKMDRNAYNKDNETNWVNWNGKEMNAELFAYYQGMIGLRNGIPELRNAKDAEINFQILSETALAYFIQNKIAIYINANANQSIAIDLPKGEWLLLANGELTSKSGIKSVKGELIIPPSSGIILIQK